MLTKITSLLAKAMHKCVERFPVPALLATLLAAFSILLIIDNSWPGKTVTAIYHFLSFGLVLSLGLSLWDEEHRRTRTTIGLYVAAFLLLVADVAFVYFDALGAYTGIGNMLMHASIVFALVLSVFLVSFTRERDDIPAWNFSLRLVLNMIACGMIGGVLCGGLQLLLGSLDWLFGVQVGWKWYAVTAVVVACWLPALLFLGRIPDGVHKHDSTPLHSTFLAGAVRYLFVPLELLYMLVLYAYALQILLRWQLPDGQVSWLVITSVVGLIGIEFGLYPARKAENRSADTRIARLLPLALTPLLLLMTVGIARRFSDYGITIARLYLAALNVWFYTVCIGLYLTRARRLHWIPISFAALFLLTSVLPFNCSSATKHVLLRQSEQALRKAGATQLPMSADSYDAFMQQLPADEASNVSAKLLYLNQTFDKEPIGHLVDLNGQSAPFRKYMTKDKTTAASRHDQPEAYSGYATTPHIKMPQGYSELLADISGDAEAKYGTNVVEVPLTAGDEVHDTIVVNLKRLKKADLANDGLLPLPTKTGKNKFLTSRYSVWFDNLQDSKEPKVHVSLGGYLLIKDNK